MVLLLIYYWKSIYANTLPMQSYISSIHIIYNCFKFYTITEYSICKVLQYCSGNLDLRKNFWRNYTNLTKSYPDKHIRLTFEGVTKFLDPLMPHLESSTIRLSSGSTRVNKLLNGPEAGKTGKGKLARAYHSFRTSVCDNSRGAPKPLKGGCS